MRIHLLTSTLYIINCNGYAIGMFHQYHNASLLMAPVAMMILITLTVPTTHWLSVILTDSTPF